MSRATLSTGAFDLTRQRLLATDRVVAPNGLSRAAALGAAESQRANFRDRHFQFDPGCARSMRAVSKKSRDTIRVTRDTDPSTPAR
jgi:hypothetical protein